MANEKITYNLASSFIAAIFSKIPLVIVEGEDDVQFYKKISEGKKLRILPSELVKKNDNSFYSAGCEGVIQVIEDIQPSLQTTQGHTMFILGIIDWDCRKYIDNTDIQLECLFKLKYYSYESHFLTNNSCKQFLSYVTNTSPQSISLEILDVLLKDFDKVTDHLYYAALEALKGRCDPCYQRIVTYETKPEALYHTNGSQKRIIDKVLDKKCDLDLFANSKSITYADTKNIIKGKWYLYAFCMHLYSNIANLSFLCEKGYVNQCDYCKNEKFDKCIWKVRIKLNRGDYVNSIINVSFKDEPEIEYIKEKLESLGLRRS